MRAHPLVVPAKAGTQRMQGAAALGSCLRRSDEAKAETNSMTARPRIGFVGLGNMGRPMADNLMKAGFELAVADADPRRLAGLGVKALLPASLAELGRMSDIVIAMLPDGKIVRHALLGDAGGNDHVLAGLASGSMVIDMSSSAPVGTRELGAALASRGIALVDAPVSGGVKRA